VEEKKYSDFYKQLVTGKYDIEGHVAYALYKNEKIKYIEDFKSEKGHTPSDAELTEFYRTAANMMEYFKREAARILTQVVGDTAKDIAKNDIQVRKSTLDAQIKWASKHPFSRKHFWFGTLQSIIGAIVLAVALAVMLFTINNGGYALPGLGQ
jgi:carboxypeptidase C (cathepsin A)